MLVAGTATFRRTGNFQDSTTGAAISVTARQICAIGSSGRAAVARGVAAEAEEAEDSETTGTLSGTAARRSTRVETGIYSYSSDFMHFCVF